MEHKDRLAELLGIESGPNTSFERFLQERACTPLSEMKLSGTPKKDETKAQVPDESASAEDTSSNETENRTATVDPEYLSSAPVAVERAETLTVKHHPTIGAYIQHSLTELSVDSEWQQVYVESAQYAVNLKTDEVSYSAACELVIGQIQRLERQAFLMRGQSAGLRIGLEELLKATTHAERSRLMDLQRNFKATEKKRAATVKREASPAKSKGLTQGMKTAKTFHGLMMTKEAVVKKLTEYGQLDDAVRAYVDKLFA